MSTLRRANPTDLGGAGGGHTPASEAERSIQMSDEAVTPEQLSARLRRIEGQVRGIARMLEGDRACEDVVTQLMAVRSGIDTVGALVLDSHIERCLSHEDEERLVALRDSMRLWWRFAPGAAGFAAPGGSEPLPVDSNAE